MSVYGDVLDKPVSESFIQKPLSCYGVGKLAAEHYLEIYKEEVPFVSLRMFNVYGPGQDLGNLRQGMVSIFLAQALYNNKILVKGDLNRFRDFIYIDDVVEIWYMLALDKKVYNKIVNVGTGKKTTLKELLRLIKSLDHNYTFYTEGNTPGDQKGIFSDSKLLVKLTNKKKFTDLNKGIRLFYEWAKEIK